MKTDEYLKAAANLGIKAHGYFVSDRTREIQKDLLHASIIGLGGALGLWGLGSLASFNLPDLIDKSKLIPIFLFLFVGYQLLLYIFSFWIDCKKYGYDKAMIYQEAKVLGDDAMAHFITLHTLANELFELADGHRKFLEQHGIESDDSVFRERCEELKSLAKNETELGKAKNKVLKDIAFGSSRLWKLTLLFEFIVPVIISSFALVLIYIFLVRD
ncbi:MAG: hypothetical protein B0W54_01405 [Cellvibrio sp. 79]|nr:MAG: hypothetical protein B0W54_01405 [Cellvibrio sp. 79]